MTATRVLIICLASILLLCPGEAGTLSAGQLARVCAFSDAADVDNCSAFLRATPDRLQAQAIYLKKQCRSAAFGPADIASFNQYVKASKVPGNAPAAVLAFTYWADVAAGIPCAATGEAWTAGQLQQKCQADNSGGSPCKFYIVALVDFTKIEDAISGHPTFCPASKPQIAPNVVSDADIQVAFEQWLSKKPADANAPAAKVFVDAISSAYPCTP